MWLDSGIADVTSWSKPSMQEKSPSWSSLNLADNINFAWAGICKVKQFKQDNFRTVCTILWNKGFKTGIGRSICPKWPVHLKIVEPHVLHGSDDSVDGPTMFEVIITVLLWLIF